MLTLHQIRWIWTSCDSRSESKAKVKKVHDKAKNRHPVRNQIQIWHVILTSPFVIISCILNIYHFNSLPCDDDICCHTA